VLAVVGLFVPAAVSAWHGLRRRPGQRAANADNAECNTKTS
jgi:hypothetical protein